ncbi:general substrate transporter [Globomyces pollinis-pini]|nr:general substrate transporter [Globomyces pollinis-pini]KAJ2994675.1 hypothetical protein HDV02_001371 [Globomyces sp. JEL0801]
MDTVKPKMFMTYQLYFAIFICSFTSAVNGFDNSLMGNMINLPGFINRFGNQNIGQNGDGNSTGLLFCVIYVGAILGSVCAGPLSNAFGRVFGLKAGSVAVLAGGAVETLATNIGVFMIGRTMIGFGLVFLISQATTYVVEIAHPAFRSRAGSFCNTGWFFGSIPASFIMLGVTRLDASDFQWQLPAGLQCFFAVIVFFGAFFMPETPRWLVSKGRVEEAREFFVKHHANGNTKDPIVDEQMNELQRNISGTQNEQTFLSFLSTRANRYRTVIIIAVAFFSQTCGNFVASYFLPQVTIYFGVPAEDAFKQNLLQVVINIFSFAASMVGVSYSEHSSRRNTLFYGTCSFVVCFSVLTGFIAMFTSTGQAFWGILAFIALQAFTICYSLVWTPLNALYPAECLNFQGRATGMAMLQFFINMASIFQSFVLAKGLTYYSYKFFLAYIGFDIFAAIFIYYIFPETNGRSPEDVDSIFEAENVVAHSLSLRDNSTLEMSLKQRK